MRKSSVRKSLLAIPGIAGVAGLGLLSAAPARAGTIFSADFEAASGYAVGGLPTAGTETGNGIYPAQSNGVYQKPAGHTGIYWDTQSFGPAYSNDAYVVANPNPTDPNDSSAQAAAFVGDSSGGVARSSAVTATLGLLDTTHDITINESGYAPSSNSTGMALTTAGSYGGNLPVITFGNEGNYNGDASGIVWSLVTARDTNGYASAWANSGPLAPDAWHTMSLTIHLNQSDLAASTMDMSVDGISVETGDAYDASGLATNSQLFTAYSDAQPAAEGDRLYLDDVSITQAVPEPASLGLVGLGGLLLVRRRNKKIFPDKSSS